MHTSTPLFLLPSSPSLLLLLPPPPSLISIPSRLLLAASSSSSWGSGRDLRDAWLARQEVRVVALLLRRRLRVHGLLLLRRRVLGLLVHDGRGRGCGRRGLPGRAGTRG